MIMSTRGPKCEGKTAVYEEKRQRFKTEDATVEVTVKLKKRSDKSKSGKTRVDQIYDAEAVVHRAGSWGDLLLRQKRVTESQASVSNAGDQGAPSRSQIGGRDDKVVAQVENRPPRHKRKTKVEKIYHRRDHQGVRSGGRDLVDNGTSNGIQIQVPTIPHGSHSKCCDACTCFESNVKDQESQTSVIAAPRPPPPPGKLLGVGKSPPTKDRENARRPGLVENREAKASHSAPERQVSSKPRKSSLSRHSEQLPTSRNVQEAYVQTQTKERIVSTVIRESEEGEHLNLLKDLKKLSNLEKENELLKYDTAKLIEQVHKSKSERQEYITTIKELYELAEVLRHENVILIGTHEEHRTLQEKLIEALGENQVLKRHLEELSSRISQTTIDKPKDNEIRDFWKVRDVLKEVKTVIAEEINELQHVNGRNSPKADDSDIIELFGRTRGPKPKELNDTNVQCDKEIQKIMNLSREVADRSDIRSSTQYLDVEDADEIPPPPGRNFVPSPVGSDLSSL